MPTNTENSYALTGAFLVAAAAALGSLYASQVSGWQPCDLCLYQRIFMYPLVIILGFYLWNNRRPAAGWVLLPVIGFAVSLYHHLLVRFDPTQSCGFALPCSMEHGFYLGAFALQPMYLPLLAAIAFAVITCCLFAVRRVKKIV